MHYFDLDVLWLIHKREPFLDEQYAGKDLDGL